MVPYRELRVMPTDGDMSAFERLLPADEDLASETYTAPRAVSIMGEREERSSAAMRFPDVTAGTFQEVSEKDSLATEVGSIQASAPEATAEQPVEGDE